MYNEFMDYLNFINGLLSEAAKITENNFNRTTATINEGDSNQVVTEADLETGRLLIGTIREKYPDHNIIDEETGVHNRQSEFTWVIDPIDGTSNFAAGLPMYGIMIGLLLGDQPIAGGIALPFFHEIYLAEKKGGSFCNGKKISVSGEKELGNCLIAYGIDGNRKNPDETIEETRLIGKLVLNIRNLRTSNSCFDIAMVAKGKYGAWITKTSRIWDNIAPQIIIEETGGIYENLSGGKIDYSSPTDKADANFAVLATTPLIYPKIREIIG